MEAFVNGIKLHYVDEGTGFPLIVLHGLGLDVHSMEPVIHSFSTDFRVIAIDARGHGLSDKPAEYRLSDHVRDVIAVMDFLKLDKVYLVGGSMGSYIAQGVAIAAPERVKKLVLVTPKSNGRTSSMARLFSEHAEELEGMDTPAKLQHLSRYMFHNLSLVGAWMQHVQEGGTSLTEEQNAASNRALEGFDFRPDYGRITAETLIISGKYDGLNPPEWGREIADAIKGARFVEFLHSGHAPHVEEPERFDETVRSFLLAPPEQS
ncbi:alpha/beta fold hydrolase [Paenibacillus favisporus]|uniref:alpha/beta fold hydrolase n=1 Tax=Paenibacillus favisporus TaxID=221028 RepID=UPI0013D23FE2|nr:alpha/beta fold hydrolase [Paenibacillus favisporus]